MRHFFPLVAPLLASRRPANISNHIVRIIVAAVKRVLRAGPQADFGQKLLEADQQEFDSAAAVAEPVCVLWIRAAMLGVHVSKELGRYPAHSSCSVSQAVVAENEPDGVTLDVAAPTASPLRNRRQPPTTAFAQLSHRRILT